MFVYYDVARGRGRRGCSPLNIKKLPTLLPHDELRQVARLVHIAAAHDGHVVADELERHHGHEREQRVVALGDFNHVVRHLGYLAVSGRDYGHHLPLAGLDLLDVVDNLVIELVMRGQDEDWHTVVNQRNGAVFHFCRGVALGVDVGDLLEFQGALQSHGVEVSAAQVDGVLRKLIGSGHLADVSLAVEDLRYEVRHAQEAVYQLRISRLVKNSSLAAQEESHHGEHHHLAGESLGGGHANLRACVGVYACVGLSGYGGAHDIAYAEDERAPLLGHADGRQGVCRLAALRDGYDNVVGPDDGVAVAELGRVLDLDRDSGELLKKVLAHEAGVERRATGHDYEPLGLHEARHDIRDATKAYGVGLRADAAPHGVGHGAGLLMDLLEHIVVIATFVNIVNVEVDTRDDGVEMILIEAGDIVAVTRERGHLLIFKVNEPVSILHDGRGVRRQEIFAIANAHRERAALARSKDSAGLVGADDAEAIGPHHPFEGGLDGLLGREALFLIYALEETGQDLGVGLGLEGVTFLGQAGFDLAVVLDYAVVDHDELAVHGDVRMGVDIVWLSVRRPPGVADADGAAYVLALDLLEQVCHFAPALKDAEPILAHHGHAGRVIAPIFKPLKAFYYDWPGGATAHVAHNSTHNCILLLNLASSGLMTDVGATAPSEKPKVIKKAGEGGGEATKKAGRGGAWKQIFDKIGDIAKLAR